MGGVKDYIIAVFGMWGKPIINVFVLITGWFMCKRDITLHKWVKTIIIVLFYNVSIHLIFVLSGHIKFSLSRMIFDFLPVKSVATNFVSCYLLFYLMIPFINILIKSIDMRQHFMLIAIMGGIYVVLGSTPKFSITFNYISWFLFVYMLSAYARIYLHSVKKGVKYWGIRFIITYFLAVISVVSGVYISRGTGLRAIYYFLEDSNKILAIMLAFSIFSMFNSMNIKNNKINIISKTTFGVLLIHTNSETMRNWIWNDLLRCTTYFNTSLYLIHAVCSVLLVYLACVFIEEIRIVIFDKTFDKASDTIAGYIRKIAVRQLKYWGIGGR